MGTSHSSKSTSIACPVSMSAGTAGTSHSFVSTSTGSLVSMSETLSTKLCPLSGKLGPPAEAISGIAKKAAEILQTDGAIVSAPDQPPDAKMVISRSGKHPHLVLPMKKSAGLSCDDECPQYQSIKLCSHTVAASPDREDRDPGSDHVTVWR